MGPKMRKVSLHELTTDFVGKQYILGQMDCFILIYQYLKKLNISLPNSFNGQTINSYPELYKKNKLEAKIVMIDFISSLLEEIKPQFSKAGDILLLKYRGNEFLGINLGNGMIMTAVPEFGVTISSRSLYQSLKAWRV